MTPSTETRDALSRVQAWIMSPSGIAVAAACASGASALDYIANLYVVDATGRRLPPPPIRRNPR